MSSISQNLKEINHNIAKFKNTKLIAISKNFSSSFIEEAINNGCNIFGENRVEEAKSKFLDLKNKYPNLKLHLVGHLQSKKAKDAVAIFDVIQSLDSNKLAEILQKEMIKQNKFPEIFIQINIGQESQKSGINPKNAKQFIENIKNNYPQINLTGLMAIAPINEDASAYFALLRKISEENNLKKISMGMSSDYEIAAKICENFQGEHFVRIGSAIFGSR